MTLCALVVRIIHLLIILAVISGPFILSDKSYLTLYSVAISCILIHWFLNNDKCVMTELEAFVTGQKVDSTFLHSIVNPIYKIRSCHIWIGTSILLLLAFIKLLQRDTSTIKTT